jgi:hypothetical protein
MVNRANDIAFARKHGMSLKEYDDYIDRKGHSGEPRFTSKYKYTNHGWALRKQPEEEPTHLQKIMKKWFG